MTQRAVVVGRGSLADALAKVVGVPAPERPQTPAITRNGGALIDDEQELRRRLSETDNINSFREALRTALATTPELRGSMIELADRFSANEGHPKLLALLTDIKTEMEKPEFDFGDPLRLRRWINYMFQRKAKTV